MHRVFVIAGQDGLIPFRNQKVDPYLFADNFFPQDECDASRLAQGNGFHVDEQITQKVYAEAVTNHQRFSWKEQMRSVGLDVSGRYQPQDYTGLSVVADRTTGEIGYIFKVEDDSVEIEELERAQIGHRVLD